LQEYTSPQEILAKLGDEGKYAMIEHKVKDNATSMVGL
jgi:hypothetical protein